MSVAQLVIRRGIVRRLDDKRTDEVEELRQRVRRAEREREHWISEAQRSAERVRELEAQLVAARRAGAVV